MAPGGVEPPVPVARLNIPGRIVQTSAPSRIQTTRKGATMSSLREAWLCVFQDADGHEETELITIECNGDGRASAIELTNGLRNHLHCAGDYGCRAHGEGGCLATLVLIKRAAYHSLDEVQESAFPQARDRIGVTPESPAARCAAALPIATFGLNRGPSSPRPGRRDPASRWPREEAARSPPSGQGGPSSPPAYRRGDTPRPRPRAASGA